MPISTLLDYFDKTAADWESNPQSTTVGDPIFPLLKNMEDFGMPEPYFGNPYCCSAVMININPGQTIDTNNGRKPFRTTPGNVMVEYGFPEKNFRDLATKFPYLDPAYTKSQPYLDMVKSMRAKGQIKKGKDDSASWWERRQAWADRIISMTPVSCLNKRDESNNLEGAGNPFALELCPWHSYKWDKKTNYSNPTLQGHIKTYVFNPAYEILKNGYSRLPFGLLISSEVINAIASAIKGTGATWEKLFTWDKVWAKNNGKEWPANSKGKIGENNRSYDLYCYKENPLNKDDKGVLFLCTHGPGGNTVPSDDFIPQEKIIVDDITHNWL